MTTFDHQVTFSGTLDATIRADNDGKIPLVALKMFFYLLHTAVIWVWQFRFNIKVNGMDLGEVITNVYRQIQVFVVTIDWWLATNFWVNFWLYGKIRYDVHYN